MFKIVLYHYLTTPQQVTDAIEPVDFTSDGRTTS
jgi:hypothetical protein